VVAVVAASKYAALHQLLTTAVTVVQVEVLLPEFWDANSGPLFSEDGDQQRFWKLTRKFTDDLMAQTGKSQVTAVRLHHPVTCHKHTLPYAHIMWPKAHDLVLVGVTC
jgi:hypothetical protein